jgi:hypothetical protein
MHESQEEMKNCKIIIEIKLKKFVKVNPKTKPKYLFFIKKKAMKNLHKENQEKIKKKQEKK